MIRDSHSKALVETDVTELQKYRREKKKEKEFQQLKEEVHSLRVCINSLNDTIKKLEGKL
jgi:predicted RNase H-like nuclease (RuvC/YqgF family)